MKEQIQKYAIKHIKGGCYLKVTLGHRGLKKCTIQEAKSPVKISSGSVARRDLIPTLKG
jgi:hypothetical protein